MDGLGAYFYFNLSNATVDLPNGKFTVPARMDSDPMYVSYLRENMGAKKQDYFSCTFILECYYAATGLPFDLKGNNQTNNTKVN